MQIPDKVECWLRSAWRKQTQDLLISSLFLQNRYAPICNIKKYIYKTKYTLLHHSRTCMYINIYIGIESTCMYKGHLNRTAFIKANVAQSVEHQTTTLRVLGSSPTVGKTFSLYILLLSTRYWQVD